MKRFFLPLLALAFLLSACDPHEPAVTEIDQNESLEALAGKSSVEGVDQFVVEFKSSVEDLRAAVEALGGTVKHAHPEIGIATVTGVDNEKKLKKIKGVRHATQDVMVQWIPTPQDASAQVLDDDVSATSSPPVPKDPRTAFFYPCQWKLDQIDAEGAWNQGAFGEANVKVAVLDTGIDPAHQDLNGKVDLVNSRSMLTSSPCGPPDTDTYLDLNFHGTFVSSQVTSNNFGIAAPATNTVIVGVKVLNCTGSGTFGDVIAGLYYAGSLPDVHVVNASLGSYFQRRGNGRLIGALTKAVNFVESNGKLFVAAAGNDGQDLQHDKNFVSVPAELGSGMSIYATDYFQNLASYSNHGVNGTDIGAPGGDLDPGTPPQCPFLDGLVIGACSTESVFFACTPGTYLIGSGTSYASPLVAGVAALVDGEEGGSLNAGQLHSILQRTADDLGRNGTDNLYSHGRLNAAEAVAEVTTGPAQ